MDYGEEQAGEMEALLSIYENELQVLETAPRHVFTMPIKVEGHNDGGENNGLQALLRFEYTPKYPDEAPIFQIEETENMDDDVVREFSDFIQAQFEENLGMVMIFTVVSAAIEWLGNKEEELRERRVEEEKRRKDLEEEAENKRLEGTKVTIEAFLEWKKRFDEQRALERKKRQGEKDAQLKGKLTGRQLFMRDSTLNDSDVKFLEAAGETVKVDESLFEDLDDLDLDDVDDDDDDPDWNPGDDVSD